MTIYIKTLDGETHCNNFNYSDTIRTVKEFIYDRTNILPSLQLLVHAGRLLSNELATLDDWNIRRGSTLHWLTLLSCKWTHYIEIPKDKIKKTLSINLCYCNFVEDIKFQIQDKTGIPCEAIKVINCGRELGDSESIIELVLYFIVQ